MICPDCAYPLSHDDFNCRQCRWKLEYIKDIPYLLSSQDKESSDFHDYQLNYDKICDDDLSHSIVDKTYLRIQAEKLKSYIGNIANLDVCEVGVGQGGLFELLKQDKPSLLTGVDISLGYLDKLKQALPKEEHQVSLVIANAENLPYKDKFDVMVASDILEHVLNVGNFLYSANRSLKMGGKLVIRVPYHENIMQYSQFFGCKYKFVHLRNFSKKSLKDLMKYAGFKVNKCFYDGFFPGRKRPYIKKNDRLNKYFNQYISKNFESQSHVAGINPILGRLLMQPVEINLTCIKTVEHDKLVYI